MKTREELTEIVLEVKAFTQRVMDGITAEHLARLEPADLKRKAEFAEDLLSAVMQTVLKHVRWERTDKGCHMIVPVADGTEAYNLVEGVVMKMLVDEKGLIFQGRCSHCGRVKHMTQVESVEDTYCECGQPIALLPVWGDEASQNEHGLNAASALATLKLS